jgi:hypothetical protein
VLHFPVRLQMMVGLSLFAFIAGARAAETGDVDGDGRISIADMVHLEDGLPPAEGSLDAFRDRPCFPWKTYYVDQIIPALVYLESLRRAVPDPLPHWEGPWPAAVQAEPLEPDPGVRIILEGGTAAGGADDRVDLRFTLETDAPIRAHSLVFELEGGHARLPPVSQWDVWDWFHSWGVIHQGDPFQGQRIDLSVPGYLLTNGRLPAMYSRVGPYPEIPAGTRDLTLGIRLARGTPPGTYAFRLLASSEVLLSDGTLVAPTIVGQGALVVEREVTAGWDEGIPPIQIDVERREVLGRIAFRATPAQGLPGDTVAVKVQMYTEVPLNHVYFKLQWKPGVLECAGRARPLLVNPEDGKEYERSNRFWWCFTDAQSANHVGELYLNGWAHNGPPNTSYPDRPLEYFKPLGEWVDLTEILLTIPDGAAGGSEVPLVFDRFEWGRLNKSGTSVLAPPAELGPYYWEFEPCGFEFQPDHPSWTYNVSYEDSSVKVLGDDPPDPPPPPPDAGIRIVVGSVAASPGDLVEIPVFASSEKPLYQLRLALGYDPGILAVDEADVAAVSLRDGRPVRMVAPRGELMVFGECVTEPVKQCFFAVPWYNHFRPSEQGVVPLDIKITPPSSTEWVNDYPGPALWEIARLRGRILDPPSGPEAVVRGAEVTYTDGSIELRAISGGFLQFPDNDKFAPATEVVPGTVTVLGAGFLRGDSNADGGVNLTDAVEALLFLFAGGGEPACMDAADADDGGSIEITDAVVLLRGLFQGGPALPEPYPTCGADPSADRLGCTEGCDKP